MSRVVITGMGIVSPIGNDVDSFFEELICFQGWHQCNYQV